MKADLADIDLSRVPRHIACVMDGNGRWAKARGLERNQGHVAGEAALRSVVEGALDAGVAWLTVYAFSTENWNRPSDEVGFIMAMSVDVVARRVADLREKGVRVVFSGRRGAPIPSVTLDAMDDAETQTASCSTLTLNVALNYGGRAELVDAARKLVEDGVPAEQVDERAITQRLYLPQAPEVDLLVRTSNELRLSNFLLWQLAYAELYFTDVLWPDFDKYELFGAIVAYQQRDRRYGGLPT